MSTNAFGIDLGTSNIKIYSAADDKIMIEKNMIAVQNKKNVFAYGDSAYEMYEKAPGNIHISYPLCNGVIADIKNMETLIRFFVTDMSGGNIKPADFYIAVPTDITEVEKRAFYDLIREGPQDHGGGKSRGRRSGAGYRRKEFPGCSCSECWL